MRRRSAAPGSGVNKGPGLQPPKAAPRSGRRGGSGGRPSARTPARPRPRGELRAVKGRVSFPCAEESNLLNARVTGVKGTVPGLQGGRPPLVELEEGSAAPLLCGTWGVGELQTTPPGRAVERRGRPEKSQGRQEARLWPQVQPDRQHGEGGHLGALGGGSEQTLFRAP